MKTTFLILLTLLSISSGDWLTDFEQARLEAKQENKMILLNFSGSDWCAPCIKLKRDVFDQPTFQEYASERLVLVGADFPRHKKNQLDSKQRDKNEKLAEQYNPKGKFPFTLLLDAEGKIICTWDGFSGESVKTFIDKIKSHAHER